LEQDDLRGAPAAASTSRPRLQLARRNFVLTLDFALPQERSGRAHRLPDNVQRAKKHLSKSPKHTLGHGCSSFDLAAKSYASTEINNFIIASVYELHIIFL